MKKLKFRNFNEPVLLDENDDAILEFAPKATLPTRIGFNIYNQSQEKVGKVERVRSNFGYLNLPRFHIHIGPEVIVIKKEQKNYSDIYEFFKSEYDIKGEWDEPEFEILKEGEIVASVKNNDIGEPNRYHIDLFDLTLEAQVAGILFVICWIMEDESNRIEQTK